MLDYKSFPNCVKSILNNFPRSFYINWLFSKQLKCQQSFWATFESEFVAKNFKNRPIWSHCTRPTYCIERWRIIVQFRLSTVWPDWAIFWILVHFLKPLATINLSQSPTFLGNFCKGVQIYHISREIIFGQLL